MSRVMHSSQAGHATNAMTMLRRRKRAQQANLGNIIIPVSMLRLENVVKVKSHTLGVLPGIDLPIQMSQSTQLFSEGHLQCSDSCWHV